MNQNGIPKLRRSEHRHMSSTRMPSRWQTSSNTQLTISRHPRGMSSLSVICNVSSIDGADLYESDLVHAASVKFTDSAAVRMRRRAIMLWEEHQPQRVLIIKKPNNPQASYKLGEIAQWLTDTGKQVFVERVVQQKEFQNYTAFDSSKDEVDLCITLGGDGTVLYLSSLFERDVPLPPVVCFAMGTLGFLTPFDANKFKLVLTRVFDASTEPIHCTLRCRKRCEVYAAGQLVAVHHVLNECVIDRGSFPGSIDLDILVDGEPVTSAQADGLIIATPSGSTAYSMSAGGPMVAPSVPCTLLTPIAPLSLSFRPLIVPEISSIEVRLPECSRAHGRASFDGKHTIRVARSGSIKFTTSHFPLPFVNMQPLDSDWYEGITQKLKWNQCIRAPPTCDLS